MKEEIRQSGRILHNLQRKEVRPEGRDCRDQFNKKLSSSLSYGANMYCNDSPSSLSK